MTILAMFGLPQAESYRWRMDNGYGFAVRVTPMLWMRDRVMEVFDTVPFAPAAGNAPSVAAANPFAKKEKKLPARDIPETYTVEEGDTLMGISAKFYGTNRKWRNIREANKTVISPDGRVKTGQVITLPR